MNKERIIEVLKSWNPWDKAIETGVPREKYLSRIFRFVESGKIISIIGVRRSGKSTLMRQIAQKLLSQGIPRSDILIVNFEEPYLDSSIPDLLSRIYEAYLEIIRPARKPFLFLDEIQQVPHWERFVRSLTEKKEANIIISDSSSKLLSEELASALTGRQLYFELMPLSFEEFLSFRNLEIADKKDAILKSLEIKRHLYEYLQHGGFPEIVLSDNPEFRKRVLISYYQDILTRDVAGRYRVKKIDRLKSLAYFYLANASASISFNRIARSLDLPVETVRRFSSYLETSNLIFFLKRFSYRVKEQENSPRKVYAIDPGLYNSVAFKFSENAGRVVENVVALKLRESANENPFREVYYWKNQVGSKEIDFLVKEENRVKSLIQVCWDPGDEKTRKREIGSLAQGMAEFDLPEGLIITEDREAEEEVNGKAVKFIPLWKWLIS